MKMRRRAVVRDPILREILTSKFRTEQLFKDSTNENRKNGHLVFQLVELYIHDPHYLAEHFPEAAEAVVTHMQSSVKKEMRMRGGELHLQTKDKRLESNVIFDEPKKKKQPNRVIVKTVAPRKTRNKNSLF